MQVFKLGIGAAAHVLLFVVVLLSSINVARADNPIVQTIYTADPAPLVYDGRIYAFLDHDEDGSTTYIMKDWRLFSSADMANWQDHGVVMSLATFSWATERAWAGQVINRNNKFYYYAPMRHGSGNMAVGVGVSDNVTGPYKDALGKPLVENGNIDPTVFIDDDDQAYMYWGNPTLTYIKLNKDMLSYTGGINKVDLTQAGFGAKSGSSTATTFTEGPWFYKRNNLYYLIYAANCCAEDIRYSTSPRPTGRWTYKGIIMPAQGKSFTNHPGIIDFGNSSYFWYHDGALPGGGGYDRSVCIEKFTYNADGTIPTIPMTNAGAPMIGILDPYVRQEAETIAFSSGLKTEVCSEGGLDVTHINNGDYIKVRGLDFGTGATSFNARVSAVSSTGGKIELRTGSKTGTLIGTCTIDGATKGWTTVTCPVAGATGTQDLFFTFTGTGTGNLFIFNWWQFVSSSTA